MTTKSTASELRKTGISVIGDVRWGTHLCHFYETKKDLLEILIPYFKAGLENNEFCIWVVSDPLGEEEARNALRQAVPETDRYLAAGNIEIVPHTLFPSSRQRTTSGEHIEIIPHTDWYLKDGAFIAERVLNGWKQKLADALAKGYAGLRANGNEAWLTEENWKAFSEYEKTLDENLADQRMIVLCSYPVTGSTAAQIFDVVKEHQLGIVRRRGQWEIVETPELKRAKSEIQRLNAELEQRVLERTKKLEKTTERLRAEIEERKNREAELRRTSRALGESEQRFRRLVELMPVAVYTCDTSGLIQTYNHRAVELWGREPKPGDKAQRYCASLRLWSPDGKLVPHEESKMAEVLRTGVAAHDLEVVIERPDGSRITTLVNIAPLRNSDGQLIGALNCFQDITERKRAEDVVQESQQLLHLVLATLPVGVAVTNRAGDIVLANAASKRIWGDMIVSGRERWAQSKGFWHDSGKRIAPSDWASVRALSEGQTSLNELIDIETFDGQQKTIQNSSAPIRSAEGLIGGTVIVNEDVTERVRVEDALRKSEERFAAFMDNLPGYAWMKDLQGRYVYVNTMVKGLPGYRSLGKTDAQIWPADLAAEYRANDLQVIAAKKPLPTLEHYQREGKQRCMAGSKFPIFDKTGAVALVGGAGVDITERIEAEQALRESEERFRELAENIDEVFWLSDLKHTTIFYVSPAYEKLWGRSCNSLYASPRSWMDAIHPDDRERVVEVLGDHELQSVPDMVYRVIRPDGSTRWVHARGFPVHDENGAVVRIAGIAADITENRESEDALRKANRQLQILSRRRIKIQEEERRHLARELHDEIGQELTAAKINLQAAIKESDGAKSKRIHETTAILERLLGQVRQISLDLRPSTLDDLGLVPALRSLLDEQGRRASVAVHFSAKNMPANLDPEIQTTCFRIAQEAITNAVRHANATRIDVDLGRENGYLRLQVRDNGRGFDAESAQAQPAGLGLIGIKERAAMVDARAKIISSPKKGTTVDVSLPLTSSSEREGREIGK